MQAPEWIPVEAPKLIRAKQLFGQLVAASRDFIESGGVLEHRPMVGAVEYEFVPAPAALSLLLGDCLQDLRSALDHEIYAAATQRHGVSWAGLSDSMFPINVSAPGFDASSKRALRGVATPTRDLVRSVQPYQPGSQVGVALGRLNDLARIDRHRLIHLAAAQPNSLQLDKSAGGVEIQLTVEIRFIDPKYSGTDALGELNAALRAVDWTIRAVRQAERTRTDETWVGVDRDEH